MKMISIYEVRGYAKERTDQKGISDKSEESVTTILKPDSWNPGRQIIGDIVLHTTDSQSPDWNDHYMVTIEKLPAPTEPCDDRLGYWKNLIEQKQLETTAKPLITRKFR